MPERQFRVEHVARAPRGYRVRTVLSGAHEVRIAFPPGPRRKGAGKVVEILHPVNETRDNPCALGNPAELVIFANPDGERDETSELEQAVRLYERFWGKKPDQVLEVQRSARMRLDYTMLGKLIALGLYDEDARIPTPHHWEEYPHLAFDGVTLASNADGTQLYALGGDQDCSDIIGEILTGDASKDLVDLGEIAFVVYEARKQPDFKVVEWMHKFDEPRPLLGCDQVKREIFFVGGGYKIEAPGIEG